MEENKEELKNEEQKMTEETCKEDNEINNMKLELEDTTDRLKRLMAEFDNFKKRSAKEREGLYNSLLSDIISSFLPVVDNLEKAVNSSTEDAGYKQGVELVLKQFLDVLSSLGVKEIETNRTLSHTGRSGRVAANSGDRATIQAGSAVDSLAATGTAAGIVRAAARNIANAFDNLLFFITIALLF